MSAGEFVVVGRITGLFGVKGWVKVFSHTEPRDNILGYAPWYLQRGGVWQPVRLADGRSHGKGIVALINGFGDRGAVAGLIGTEIAVCREQLPAAPEDEYYWTDLIGLSVMNQEGLELGRVDHLFETGANDVMVVKGERERLIPFNHETVLEVDLKAGLLRVDWDPEF